MAAEFITNRLIKCHKCRHILIDASMLSTIKACKPSTCESYDKKKFLYLDDENLPSWIKGKIDEEEFKKGKLHCNICGYKVGSFDFISGRKCVCGESVLPPVQFISSQIDIPIITAEKY